MDIFDWCPHLLLYRGEQPSQADSRTPHGGSSRTHRSIVFTYSIRFVQEQEIKITNMLLT